MYAKQTPSVIQSIDRMRNCFLYNMFLSFEFVIVSYNEKKCLVGLRKIWKIGVKTMV